MTSTGRPNEKKELTGKLVQGLDLVCENGYTLTQYEYIEQYV